LIDIDLLLLDGAIAFGRRAQRIANCFHKFAEFVHCELSYCFSCIIQLVAAVGVVVVVVAAAVVLVVATT